jgi:hypothetical protein
MTRPASVPMEVELRDMPVSSGLQFGNCVVVKESPQRWLVFPISEGKSNLPLAEVLAEIHRTNIAAVKAKIKDPTKSSTNPNAWAGSVEKPQFHMKVAKSQTEMPVGGPMSVEVVLKTPAYLEPIARLIHFVDKDWSSIDRYLVEDCKRLFGNLLGLLYDYQRVVERMPDWVFTGDNFSADAVATGSSSVWPVDADRKYSTNPIEANDNRRLLADFILRRLGYDKKDPSFPMLRNLAYNGASAVGLGPPDSDMHGRTCGEATIRGIIEGLLDLTDTKTGG